MFLHLWFSRRNSNNSKRKRSKMKRLLNKQNKPIIRLENSRRTTRRIVSINKWWLSDIKTGNHEDKFAQHITKA